MLSTVDEIARDMIERLDPEEVKAIAGNYPLLEPLTRIWAKTAIMREVRNEYGLWYDNPLTEKWRTDESSRDIREGVDFSQDHPDNVSLIIYKRIEEIAKEQTPG